MLGSQSNRIGSGGGLYRSFAVFKAGIITIGHSGGIAFDREFESAKCLIPLLRDGFERTSCLIQLCRLEFPQPFTPDFHISYQTSRREDVEMFGNCLARDIVCQGQLVKLVGVTGFEPATSTSQT